MTSNDPAKVTRHRLPDSRADVGRNAHESRLAFEDLPGEKKEFYQAETERLNQELEQEKLLLDDESEEDSEDSGESHDKVKRAR